MIAACSDGGIKLENGTSLASIRDLRKEKQRVSLALDQLDGAGGDKMDDRLFNLLCSSTEIAAQSAHKEKVTDKKGERFQTVFASIGFPVALGKIGSLRNDALMSRCIVIRMQPETPAERARQMPARMITTTA